MQQQAAIPYTEGPHAMQDIQSRLSVVKIWQSVRQFLTRAEKNKILQSCN